MEKYKYFETELNSIKDKTIRKLTIDVLEEVNEKFLIEPASSTGKYHPDYAQGEGGLYRHTCAAVKIANCLLDLEYYDKSFSDSVKDYIRAALILHDCCKSGIDFERPFTCHERPLLACDLIKSVVGPGEYADAVCNLIRTHMGQWTKCKRSKIELPAPETTVQMFVHTCDYLASRKFLEVKFDQE